MRQIILRSFNLLFIVSGLLFLSSCEKSTEPKILSINDAENIIFRNMLNGSDSGKVVYEFPNILKAGNIISCRQLDSTDFIATSDSWFFFIDDNPNMYWVHPCRYIFVDISTAKATVHNWTYLPTCINEMKIIDY